MKFFILGYTSPFDDPASKVRPILMTRREFDTYEAAAQYASTVHPSWRPFVVTDGEDRTKGLFLESLTAWQGEEESVVQEHRPLIERMQAHAKTMGWL
jgi:hypothetical protein